MNTQTNEIKTLALLLLVLGAPLIAPGGPLDRFAWVQPRPQGNDLLCVAYGNGTFVALGNRGARLSSRDGGVTWLSQNEGPVCTMGVTYGNGLFVGVGYEYVADSGTYVAWSQVSPDGLHWTNRVVGSVISPDAVRDMAFGNGRFVAITGAGQALTSTNGLDWTKVEMAWPFWPQKIVFGNGVFVAIAGDGSMAVSADGALWTERFLPFGGDLARIAFGNGTFVVLKRSDFALPYAWDSRDAAAWDNAGFIDFSFSAMTFGAGRFVALPEYGDGTVAFSLDGTHWNTSTNGPANDIYGLTYGGGQFVAVGDKGSILTSTNGETWIVRVPYRTTNLRCIAKGDRLRVAVGNNGLVFTSPDSVTWTRQSPLSTNNLRGVAFGDGRFLAVTELGEVIISTNGQAWTLPVATPASSLYSAAYGKGLFVAVGEAGAVVTSPDGSHWTLQNNVATYRLNAVTFTGDLFLAVGKHGTIISSTNGTQWNQCSSRPSLDFLHGVAYGHGLFVTAGDGGTVMISSNGFNWAWASVRAWGDGWSDPNMVIGTANVEDVQFANGTFVAVGANGFLATSTNGVLWTVRQTSCQSDLRSSIYADGHVTIVGNNETILQSGFMGPPLLRARGSLGSEGFELAVEGEVSRTYQVQGSDDMQTWEDLMLFTNEEEKTLFLDTDADWWGRRFYRVLAP